MVSHAMPRPLRSKEDLVDGPPVIIEEDGSDWLKNDLCYLIQSPLDVQLNAILGSVDADTFLNPTIKDKKKLTLADSGINVSKKQDAHELWNNLRLQSQRKLNKKEKEIPCNVNTFKNKRYSDDKILRKIQYSRHRTELMHRVSQMNRTKTKELLKDFYLPSIDDDDDDIIHSVVQCDRSLNPIAESSCEHLGTGNPITTTATTSSQQLLMKQSKSDNQLKVRFVSEEDCSSPGEFKQRMRELGVVVNNGVSMNGFKASSTHLVNKDYIEKSQLSDSKCLGNEGREGRSWEPLTMRALEEHKEPVAEKEWSNYS